MKEKFFEDLKEKIQPYFEKGGSHSFDHTQRVYNLALKISEGESVDIDVIRAAALLHDIARKREDENEVECHACAGAEMAEKILKEMGYPGEKIKGVCYAIEIHRHSTGITPETKEAAIIQDADRLDALGAITIGRMFSSGGKIGIPLYITGIPFGEVKKGYESDSTIHGFYAKILKITPETFKTKKAREIAKERYNFVKEFVDRFLKEWEGKL